MRYSPIIAMMLVALLALPVLAQASQQQVVMDIRGMTCELCPLAIKKSLEKVPGVKEVKVSLEEKKAWLTVDGTVTDKALADAVQKAGEYTGKVIERKPAR
jgi:mercuric ion binding protein